MSNPTLKVTVDFVKQFNAITEALKGKETLVGIPEEKGSREDDAPINNAALLYINNFGSPAQNIPARPVMEIGIRSAQEDIADQYKQAAKNVFSQGVKALDIYYERAGSIASSSIKNAINEQTDIDPPAESTLATRKSQGFKGTKSLVVTGQMRNAITWIVSATGALRKRGR